MSQQFTIHEVSQHNNETSCWIIIQGKVYDMTSFLNEHPGGKKIILKVSGQDASKQFTSFHNQGILTKYTPKLCIGTIVENNNITKEEDLVPNYKQEDNIGFGDMIPYGDPMWYQAYDSPYYKQIHFKVRKAMRQFCLENIEPYCYEWDEAKKAPISLFKKCADNGILAIVMGLPFPKEYYKGPIIGNIQPEEIDAFVEFIVTDELARNGSGGLIWFLIGGFGIGLPPVIQFGNEELKQRVVPECLKGNKTVCLAITEPYAGSDVANLKCTAKKTADGKHYIVNGEKKWITNGVFADYFTVAVRTGGEGMGGVSLLLLERSMLGIKTRQMQCSGMWASGTAYITFEDVKVPVENLIGEENKGFKYIMYNFNHERLGCCIQANRFARVCYEEAFKYAHKRSTFGKKLIDHPVIRNKFANMARHIEATHAWMEILIYQTDKMDKSTHAIRLGGPIALLKAQSTQTFELCAREAAQVFGGLSYTRGGQGEKVERLYREVRAYAIPGGSEEIMLDLGVRQSIKANERVFKTKF